MKVSPQVSSQPSPRKTMGRPSKFPRIKQQIRGAIIQGKFMPDEQLPAVEKLAKQFGVGGPTAKKAIDELADEGWLESRHGVGTFVRLRKGSSQILLTAPRSRGWEPCLAVENLDAFHSKHPHVRIVLSSEPTTDLIATDSYSLVVDRLRGQTLQSLDELQKQFGREPWKLPEQMRVLASDKAVLFGLPMCVNLILLQTNPRLLEAARVTPPERHMTWEQRNEILTRCHQDRDGDGVVECFGAFSKLGLYEWLIPFWQRGGRLDSREAFFHSQAIGVLNELWEMHHKVRTLPIEMTHGQSEAATGIIRQRFFEGQIAMRWISSTDLFEASPLLTTPLIPRFGSLARQEVHASLLGIHRDCTHPDVALEFLDFCYRKFIQDNPEYPFALAEEHRHLLKQVPAVHRLLQEGLSDASEPLHEGSPTRTWAIEKEIYDCFRLLRTPDRMSDRLQKIWDQQAGSSETGIMSLGSWMLPWSHIASPVGQLVT